jgi:hypothetical protein
MKTKAVLGAYTVDNIHAALKDGYRVIHPTQKAYEYFREPILSDAHPDTIAYQSKHFATREGFTLSLRCTDNYFGALVSESEVDHA